MAMAGVNSFVFDSNKFCWIQWLDYWAFLGIIFLVLSAIFYFCNRYGEMVTFIVSLIAALIIFIAGTIQHHIDSINGSLGWTVGQLFNNSFVEEYRSQSEVALKNFWQRYLTEIEGEVPESVIGKKIEVTLDVTRVDVIVSYGRRESSSFPSQYRIEGKVSKKLWVVRKNFDSNARQPKVGDKIKVSLILAADTLGDAYVKWNNFTILD